MSRRRAAVKRVIIPDPVYGDVVVSKFMSCIMERGKKSIAEKILYGSFDVIRGKGGNSIEVFREALTNVKPLLEVRSRRIGGATYQIPCEVRPERAQALAMRWIITSAKKRSEKTMSTKLAGELMDAAASRGNACKKREEVHKMAEANKALASYSS